MNLLQFERWPDWLHVAYPRSVGEVVAVAVPPEEAGADPAELFIVRRQLFNVVLARVDPGFVIEQWCYLTLGEAMAALVLWDGVEAGPLGTPGPQGWIRHLSRRGSWRRDPVTGEVVAHA